MADKIVELTEEEIDEDEVKRLIRGEGTCCSRRFKGA